MSIYDIPRTPTPDLVQKPRNNSRNQSRIQRASDSMCVIQSKQILGVFRVTEKAKNPVQVLQRHANTRKRRLPVNQLALLRMTTSDGLPHPNDFDVTFSGLIGATDPIADSQANNPLVGSIASLMSGKEVGLENRPAPYKTQPLVTGNLPAKNLPNSASVMNETLRGTSGPVLESVPDVHVIFEGLPRHEFQGTSRQSDRRGNYASAGRNKPTIVRKLTLASGPLPLPADADLVTFRGMRTDDKHGLSGPRTLHKIRHRLTGAKAAHAQLNFVNSRGMCQDGMPSRTL